MTKNAVKLFLLGLSMYLSLSAIPLVLGLMPSTSPTNDAIMDELRKNHLGKEGLILPEHLLYKE